MFESNLPANIGQTESNNSAVRYFEATLYKSRSYGFLLDHELSTRMRKPAVIFTIAWDYSSFSSSYILILHT